MKKNYFYALFASLMLFMAMPASAQVTMVDLYGKWKFTADISTVFEYFEFCIGIIILYFL